MWPHPAQWRGMQGPETWLRPLMPLLLSSTSVGLDNVSAADESSKDPTAFSVPTLVCTESVGLESVSEVLAAAPIVAVERPKDATAFSVPTLVCIDSVGLDRVSAPEDSPKDPTASSVPTLVCTESVGLESVSEVLAAAPIWLSDDRFRAPALESVRLLRE